MFGLYITMSKMELIMITSVSRLKTHKNSDISKINTASVFFLAYKDTKLAKIKHE